MKQKTNSGMNDLSPAISLTILNVNELNTAVKRQKLSAIQETVIIYTVLTSRRPQNNNNGAFPERKPLEEGPVNL